MDNLELIAIEADGTKQYANDDCSVIVYVYADGATARYENGVLVSYTDA